MILRRQTKKDRLPNLVDKWSLRLIYIFGIGFHFLYAILRPPAMKGDFLDFPNRVSVKNGICQKAETNSIGSLFECRIRVQAIVRLIINREKQSVLELKTNV